VQIDLIIDSRLDADTHVELGLLAERCGLRAVWNSSYLDGRDPFGNLVPLARRTHRIRMGPIALNPFELHPFRIAMNLLTLNESAGGRAEAVVGAGGEVVMALGMRPERRVRAVRECIEIVRGVSAERPFSYAGELFSVTDYDPFWATAPAPRVYAAANRRQMLDMAAEVADGIMMSDLSPSLATWAIARVRARAAAVGRPLDDFRFNNFMAWYVHDDLADARREARRWIGFRALFREYMSREFLDEAEFAELMRFIPEIYAMPRLGTDSVPGLSDVILDKCVDHLTLTGTPDRLDPIIEHLRELKAAGVDEICLEIRSNVARSIELIGERVLPALRD